MKFLEKIRLILTKPGKFFDKIEDDKSMIDVFKFYFNFILIITIINTLVMLPELTKNNLGLSFGKYCLFVIVLIVYILAIVLIVSGLSFVIYWVYHILIKIFRGKKKYLQTYKLLYAATPLLIVSLINFYKPVFNILFLVAALYTFYIEYIGLRKLQKLSKENAITVIIISVVIAVLLILFLIKRGLIIL